MSNNFNIKNCIEEEQLLLYLKGQLSQKEIRQVELHLTDCELCSDALEGLRLLKNRDHADEIVTELKHNINKKLLNKQRTLPVTQQWWQIAAIFIVLITGIGGYVYINHFTSMQSTVSDNKKSERQQLEIEKIPEPVSDAKQPVQEENMVPPSKNKDTEELAKVEFNGNSTTTDDASQTFNGNSGADVQRDEVNADLKMEDLRKKDIGYSKDEGKTFTDITTETTTSAPAAASPSAVNESYDDKEAKAKSLQKASSAKRSDKQLIDQGMVEVRERKYDDALETFEGIISDPAKDYFKAITYYNSAENDSANYYFDNVINFGKSDYYEDAFWYKANIMVRKGNNGEAKTLLTKIISLKGKRETEAATLLKSL